jgi:hypothetical protein
MDDSEYEYDIALSFAGEQRDYVEDILEYLDLKGVKYFYDKEEEVTLWGQNLVDVFNETYKNKARYCVMFISEDYAKKAWPNHERKSAMERQIKQVNDTYILPVRFDDTELPGLPSTVGYVNAKNKTPQEVAQLILKKLENGSNEPEKSTSQDNEFRQPEIESGSFNRYEASEEFIEKLSNELRKRASEVDELQITEMNREGKTCLRVVSQGETIYSLDVWMGGVSADDKLSFYGVKGKPSMPGNSKNAMGKIIQESGECMLDLHDLSLLEPVGSDLTLSYDEFIKRIWDKICDSMEEKLG